MLFKRATSFLATPLVAVSLLSAGTAPAGAAIMLGGTRVIINERDREASISMKNEAKAPFVVQAWIDAGEGKTKTPFLVTPPLSRLDPGVENILRVLRTSSDLPRDRESVFWLNVKEIPERTQEENVLQVAVRSRIKLFYRPSTLNADEALAARNQLKWAVAAEASGKGAVLKIVNPTPFHITFTFLQTNNGSQPINPDMVPPLGELVIPLPSVKTPQAMSLRFTTINDYGGETAEEIVDVPVTNEPVTVVPRPVPEVKKP
ncbi:molecular chaperone [Achromobacter sp. UMC71]|uniref:fimbrial biogenesis chaperone n=1 Tax=Achromobacter sp. UMC71 TaxID=1862320 RepID=UPI0015FEC019|nr:molecular chaperone [Achromobacter sp. UMC71]MBB1628497.1 P pilus assembly chaperone PapD [Achromobacter sp. UMC71]